MYVESIPTLPRPSIRRTLCSLSIDALGDSGMYWLRAWCDHTYNHPSIHTGGGQNSALESDGLDYAPDPSTSAFYATLLAKVKQASIVDSLRNQLLAGSYLELSKLRSGLIG